ncbi:Na+/H+ antiporter subunit G [Corynebacterium vitaeruminis]|uniref:Putative monovalent cation/H+ antiporter subunit G n=1 Tax=Corynebacterium vitaeruminis DSM 20294 TaxID=1224164 RepID=W5XY95_9CORY|nr:Na+/H+ antiporter subunit G [Corynebacterium vitaeruminis]AHI21674.1 putative monovalent cation/H+ antiporter subunit G [Corynebacterium vitaeruminis DSM 20294]
MAFDIIAGALIIFAGILMVITAVALWRAPDALTRANLLGPTTGVAMPSLVIAKVIHDIGAGDVSVGGLIRALLAIVAFLVVLAIGSFVMGRSLLGLALEQEDSSSR